MMATRIMTMPAILLPTNLGAKTGWYGFSNLSDSELLASEANALVTHSIRTGGHTMVRSSQGRKCRSSKGILRDRYYGGTERTPVYRVVDNKRFGVAIHAYGGVTSNSGTRINGDVYNNLVAWKA